MNRERRSWLGVAVVSALSLCVFLTACHRDPQAEKQRYYNRGLAYLKKGSVNDAALQFLNALRIDPNYAEAAGTLAEVYFRQKNYRKAYSLLEQAAHAKPDYLPAHKGLIQVYRLAGRLSDSQKEAEFVLTRTPDDVETLMNLGTVQALQKNLKDAESTFQRILKLQPDHVGALLALAAASKEENDLPQAERFLKLALERNPHSVPVYLSLLKLYILAGRQTEVEALFPQAIRDTNNNVQILEAQDGYYEGSRRYADAEAAVRKIQTSHANEPAYRRTLADFFIRTSDWAKARAELQRILQRHPDDVDTLHSLIEVDLNLNDRSEAERLNTGALKKNPKDGYGHLFRGRLALSDGNLKVAFEEFNETKKHMPDWPALHFWIAQAFLKQGHLAQARQEVEAALVENPNYFTARLVLASIQNRTGLYDAALANGIRLLEAEPHDVPALLVYSESLIYKKDYAHAEKALKLAQTHAFNNPDIHLQLGIVALAKGSIPAARAEFQKAWELQPGSRSSLESVVGGYLLDRQLTTGIDYLKEAAARRPDNAIVRIELAKMYVRHGQPADAIVALQAAQKIAPANPEIDIMLADFLTGEKKTDEALSLLATATRQPSVTADLLLRAGMLYEQLQHWTDAQQAYERALAADGSNPTIKNNLASVLADHGGDLNVALTLAQQAKEAVVDNPDFTNTLGWVYYKRSLYSLAFTYLSDAVNKDQKNPMFEYQLGLAQWKLGRLTDARDSLQRALQLDSHFPAAASAREALSQIHLN